MNEHTEDVNLVILENDQVRTLSLNRGTDFLVGRINPAQSVMPDVAFHSPIVSREHGWIRKRNGRWYYTDNPRNTNGTFHNGAKMPRMSGGNMQTVPLSNGDILRVDNDDLDKTNSKGVLMLFTTVTIQGRWTTYPLGQKQVMIGRHPSCDIVENLPYISGRHAVISYQNGSYYVSNLSSSAGTFLNGKPVSGHVHLREKDCISLCDLNYFFLGSKLLYAKRDRKQEIDKLVRSRPVDRPVILTANIQSKVVQVPQFLVMKKQKELLRDIKLGIREGTLVAVLGTAGAGKSTLMGCLSGLDRDGVTGTVIYRGVDLVKNLDQIKYLIGNVPQEKVIRPELTPEKAFQESAELRLSADMTKAERDKRVKDTLELLSMTKVKDTLNSQLSGGEQTRVNVGIDLVADRDIYFLDEPEQGLSPNLRTELYEFLRTLAHSHGKTIIAIIHDVSCIDMFDQVIFLVKAGGVGRLAFSGTPEEGHKHFGVPISQAYALLEANPEKYVR